MFEGDSVLDRGKYAFTEIYSMLNRGLNVTLPLIKEDMHLLKFTLYLTEV